MTKEDFLLGVQNWNNHLHLLWPALENSTGDIIELGMGPGSTQILHDYAKEKGRNLFSYESDYDWFHKFSGMDTNFHKLTLVRSWDEVAQKHPLPSVVLIDHAPGERRRFDIEAFAHQAKFIVCHDTEPAADHGYNMRETLKKFRFMKDYQTEGAWSTIVSNSHPIPD